MKKLLIAFAGVSALAIGGPALSQSNDRYNDRSYASVNRTTAIDNRIDRLETRINAGIRQGAISRNEARSLRQRLNVLTRLERQYSRNGYTPQERADLQQRVRTLRQQIRVADNGYYDRYERVDRYGNYIDGAYGQGGPYEAYDTCEERGGIAGFLENIFGGDDDCGLRVGQTVSGNLYGVPIQYRSTYRDGNGVYYRSDGRAIYQIDSRTNRVVRAFPMNR